MQKISSLFILLLVFLTSAAQGENNSTGFDGLMRSDLKMYVVVAVLLIIFSGILLFLFSMERRLKALEG
jgi:hypothetical protein